MRSVSAVEAHKSASQAFKGHVLLRAAPGTRGAGVLSHCGFLTQGCRRSLLERCASERDVDRAGTRKPLHGLKSSAFEPNEGPR
jgi:hypothetical protein